MHLSDDSKTEIASKIQGHDFITLEAAKIMEGHGGRGCVMLYCVPSETCVLCYDEGCGCKQSTSIEFLRILYSWKDDSINILHSTAGVASHALSLSLSLYIYIHQPLPLFSSDFMLVKERPLINLLGNRCPCRPAFSVSLITAIVITAIVCVYCVIALKHPSPEGAYWLQNSQRPLSNPTASKNYTNFCLLPIWFPQK